MKQELKPCPFCGEQPMVCEKSLSVYCKNELCPETIANESDNLADAIRGWNTRPDHGGESAEISESQMRYEIAKDCVSATLSRTHIVGGEIKDVVGYSIRVADELISQLKQQNDEK